MGSQAFIALENILPSWILPAVLHQLTWGTNGWSPGHTPWSAMLLCLWLWVATESCLSAKCWVLRWPGPQREEGRLWHWRLASSLPCSTIKSAAICPWWYTLMFSCDLLRATCCVWVLSINMIIGFYPSTRSFASSTCLGITQAEQFCGGLNPGLKPRIY